MPLRDARDRLVVIPAGAARFDVALDADARGGLVVVECDASGLDVGFHPQPGLVMGTIAYMSPEQARGLKVDGRTDVWSLGVVLYEMLAGREPFDGETTSDALVSILSKEPAPLSEHAPDAPEELQWAVERALSKEREKRYKTMGEMLDELRALREEFAFRTRRERSREGLSGGGVARRRAGLSSSRAEGTAVETVKSSAGQTDGAGEARPTSRLEHLSGETKRRPRGVIIALACLLAAAAGVTFWWYRLSVQRQTAASMSARLFQRTKVSKLTTNGNARVAAVSPDGKYVAYAMVENERQSLWVRQVETAGNVQIIQPAEVAYWGVAFSPDGNYIYFTTEDSQHSWALYRVPALGQGAAATKLISDVRGVVSFSPGGGQITFVRAHTAQEKTFLMIANADGTGEQALASRTQPDSFGWFPGPAWSPDGKVVACPVVINDAEGTHNSVLEVRVGDRAERLLSSHRWDWVGYMGWLADGSGLVLNARERDATFIQLWLLPYPAGEARRITSDLSNYGGMSLTANSATLVSVQEQVLSNLWVTPKGDPRRAAQITSGAGRYLDLSWTPDGSLLYASDASGSAEIWEMKGDGAGGRQLTVNAGRNYAPVATPDGRRIVFHSNRSGTWNIWRMERDGSNPKQLTGGEGDHNFPQVSPDGQWVVYSERSSSVMKVPIDGGTPVPLTDKPAARPAISPDGKLVACWQSDGRPQPTWRIAVLPLEGGKPLRLLDVPQNAVGWDSAVRWTPDGQALTYKRAANLWIQPLDGGPPRQLTDFQSDLVFDFAWSQDGRLLLSRGVHTTDVVMLSDSR